MDGWMDGWDGMGWDGMGWDGCSCSCSYGLGWPPNEPNPIS